VPKCAIGSIWTVPELGGAHAIVLLGPYTAGHPVPEYIVAPLYTGAEPGFGWTDQDVFLDERETSLGGARYIAIWNARPVREGDLADKVGSLPDASHAIELAQDIFWGTQDRTRVHSRLGTTRTPGQAVVNFHLGEMLRWRALTVRAAQRVATAAQKSAALRLARATAGV
jgi:hypothetical protein